eukprot:CAMPEP_0113295478 /NCGR_PEP_ID=MMETSP0008_2-20120614/36486_1 /TAXON_ID=97485 /ORGANISM="Prymnesium parvum" /LENGTH=67 /DNA_ID=CAMNT_0000148225 /DNA_START=140 /DNA_END=339 /DNA_ORIENTATION=+ /assembly_acc=CAM_ASM_000153
MLWNSDLSDSFLASSRRMSLTRSSCTSISSACRIAEAASSASLCVLSTCRSRASYVFRCSSSTFRIT